MTIDHDALRVKYREERDKRLRPDGNDQYLEPTGRFASMLDDPYAERIEREPRFDDVTVALIGGGFSGLCVGARLKQAGIDDVRIIEVGGDFGGTWYWNRYPGAMCDTAAMIYLPLLEETGHMPSAKYVMAPEIFEHCQRIAKTFDLYDNALFSTVVTELEWDAAAARWIIRTDRGDAIRARFVAMGTGPLNRPKLPGIPGIETFAGHTFHTSRWDYAYTGGDWTGAPMTNLADKRVGIIGTGATAVQCIPPARARRARAVRVPTHAVVGRRPQQPSDRPRVVRDARARLAEEVAAELRDPPDRRLRRRGPREGRLDRHLATDPGPDRREGRRRQRAHARARRPRVPRERRREDGGDPRPL